MLNFLTAGPDFTDTTYGFVAICLFVIAYAMVVTEDLIKLRKSKPVVIAAGIIWVCVAFALSGMDAAEVGQFYASHGWIPDPDATKAHDTLLEQIVLHHVSEYAALFLFLMVAMTYISAIAERNVFLRINAWLVSAGYGLRAIFWTTGGLAFVISPIADNLTTALLMGAVVVTVGGSNTKFVALACCNIVVAANAGGAFSPFGDITTLMVWAAGYVDTGEFLAIFLPSVVNWLVPASCMVFFVPKSKPEPLTEQIELKDGWWVVTCLFLATIATAVTFHSQFHLPPFLGMTTGLGYLFIYGFFRRMKEIRMKKASPVDVLKNVADVEWDTMLFFFGVIMCVGGLKELGYLELAAQEMYEGWGPDKANIAVGCLSAVLDNVPVMFAVLGMDPTMGTEKDMILFQWLLITLTAGVGGSMLSVGSAAGVALMGSAHGKYTFSSHLKWLPLIALGYAASIWVHYLLNYPG
ncbi:MAG: sodium:proton antiporter NhaD [Planctomycetota bacterium]|nr:sodium:proton antiporter NhaD [Planctomycetota bacterium]